MTSQVSRFYPQTEALALTCEHWDKLSWENRSPSGILFTEQFSAFELPYQAANLECINTKETWYGNLVHALESEQLLPSNVGVWGMAKDSRPSL